jgi:hypothetical protein
MNEKRWNAVRQFYMESFGVAPELVDLMACNDVLVMCVSGSSNDSISRVLNMDDTSILEILTTVLDFRGWREDLPFNPYAYYRSLPSIRGNSLYSSFREEVIIMFGPHIIEGDICEMYRICKTYCAIEERLERDWI